jgi:hypothetical protein
MEELDGQTIHIHCIANLRVSAFLYRYRRDERHMPDAAARAEMESLWRPGRAWAWFIGDTESSGLEHHYAGRDY